MGRRRNIKKRKKGKEMVRRSKEIMKYDERK
jgi:hypothetical protein